MQNSGATILTTKPDSTEEDGDAFRLKIRSVVLDSLDDSHESATEVINALAGAIADVSECYFGQAVTTEIFESFAKATRGNNPRNQH